MKYIFLLVSALLISQAQADLLIYHLNVGMGDATLIVDTQADKTLLIDAGSRYYGKKVVAETIKRLGYSRIDYFVATHYDSDHIGGFSEIIEAGIPFGIVYDRGEYTDKKMHTEQGEITTYCEYVGLAGAERKTITLQWNDCYTADDRLIDLGEETIVDVIAVAGSFIKTDCVIDKKAIEKDEDDALSIALLIRHGDFSCFIGGDLTGGGNRTIDMESAIAATVGDIDVLKLNNHGSNTSSNKKFLSILRPEAVIISVGDKGANLRYRLPKQAVLDRVNDLDTDPIVFLTNRGEGGTLEDSRVEDGHIIIHTNGISYTINNMVFEVD